MAGQHRKRGGVYDAGGEIGVLASHSRVRHGSLGCNLEFLLNKTIALRGCLPGLGPAAEFPSLLRQRKESKKGDRRLAPYGSTRLCVAKNGKCPKLASLKQLTLLFPFSATHKRLRPKRMKIKNRVKKQRQHQRQYDRVSIFVEYR